MLFNILPCISRTTTRDLGRGACIPVTYHLNMRHADITACHQHHLENVRVHPNRVTNVTTANCTKLPYAGVMKIWR